MKKYSRFLLGLIKYLRGRMQPHEALALAETIIKDRVLHREENLLNLIKRGIYEYPKSPYLDLLRAKRIEFRDIKQWIDEKGIENTLMDLKNEGVYFTVDEYKGKSEMLRNGLKLSFGEKDFDNPFVSAAYEVRSGATRSAGARIRIDYDYLVQRSFYDAFLLNVHDALTSPIANWFPVFPGAPGINSSLRFARIGNPPKKWFTQVDRRYINVNWEKRWGTNYIFFMSKLLGVSLATPENVDLNNAYKVAKWASTMLDYHPNCVVYTFASSAVRFAWLQRNITLT